MKNSPQNAKPTGGKIKNFFHAGKAGIFRLIWFSVGILVLAILAISLFLPLVKDAGKVDYFDYVSELRSNILVASDENFSLRAFAVEREYPYAADGVKRETSRRAEIHLVAPSGDKVCSVGFSVNGNTYGGEMSYDNVKEEYFYSVSADLAEANEILFTIDYGGEKRSLTAKTVKKEDTLSPRAALKKLRENETELFQSLTGDNGFVGEIYLRLICEDSPYYYVGLIEKNGKIRAFLLAADSGKVLAKRES